VETALVLVLVLLVLVVVGLGFIGAATLKRRAERRRGVVDGDFDGEWDDFMFAGPKPRATIGESSTDVSTAEGESMHRRTTYRLDGDGGHWGVPRATAVTVELQDATALPGRPPAQQSPERSVVSKGLSHKSLSETSMGTLSTPSLPPTPPPTESHDKTYDPSTPPAAPSDTDGESDSSSGAGVAVRRPSQIPVLKSRIRRPIKPKTKFPIPVLRKKRGMQQRSRPQTPPPPGGLTTLEPPPIAPRLRLLNGPTFLDITETDKAELDQADYETYIPSSDFDGRIVYDWTDKIYPSESWHLATFLLARRQERLERVAGDDGDYDNIGPTRRQATSSRFGTSEFGC